MIRIVKQTITALLLFVLAFSFTFAEETKPSATELIKLIANAPTQEKVYELSHKLATYPRAEIAVALKSVPQDSSPRSLVAILSISLPAGILEGFPRIYEAIYNSADSEAKIAMFDLIGYTTTVSMFQQVIGVLANRRESALTPRESIHQARALWMIFTFYAPSYLLDRNDFEITKGIQEPILKFFQSNTSELIKGDAAITLGEMGKTDEDVIACIKRFANDPTDLGRRARSVLMGHPIYDEVLKRALLMHPDADEVTIKKFAMEASKGLANALDKHSTFMDEDGVKAWGESIQGEYGGIGAYVGVKDNMFTITRPFYNGPAYKAGLRSGDTIVEVNGEPISGNDLDILVSKLKGIPGTKVKLTIFRKGWTSTREFELVRGKIEVPNIYIEKLPGNVAYIRLGQFSFKAVEQMQKAISDVSKWEPEGLIFDLRGNPGGLLNAAVDVVGMFVEGRKLVVYEKGRPEFVPQNNHFTKAGTKTFTKPLVVMINDNSASASEIVSGTLKHYNRAQLVGKTTYGKGSVQIPYYVANSDFTCKFKLTIAKYFLANDTCIHGIGVTPHIEVDNMEVQGYVIDELERLRTEGILTSYINDLVKNHKDLAIKLAENDFGEASRYPGFDEWSKSIDTFLKTDMLRYVVNDELRRVVQDMIGREFPCNPGIDLQLQEGILTALRLAGKEPEKMDEVAPFVKKELQRLAELKKNEKTSEIPVEETEPVK